MKKLQTLTGWSVALLVLALLAPVEARAQDGGLKVSFTNLSLQKDSARARTQAPTTAAPGDTLRYLLTFTNTQDRAIRNVVFNNPLPAGLSFIAGSVTSNVTARVEYSIDGGVTYQERPMVTVEENGRRVQRPATPESYTHIRWTVTDSVAPGATVTARYDTRVGGR